MIVGSRRYRRDGAEDHGRMVRIMKKDGNRLEGIGERIAVRLTLLEEALGMTPGDPECGRCERPLRASSASGERVALAASETVPAGTVIEFSVLVMNPKDAETVREWLDYGHLRGLFQWRNSGKGRFEWEEVTKED